MRLINPAGPWGARRRLREALGPDEQLSVQSGASSIGAVPRKGLVAITKDRILFIGGFGGMFPSIVWSMGRDGAYAEQHKDRFYWLVTVYSTNGTTERIRVFRESDAERIVSELRGPSV